jgi:GNAT superfamily N-acetyltransferase
VTIAFSIRRAAAADELAAIELLPRLADFGPPAWRTREEIAEGETRALRGHFRSPLSGDELLVAIGPDGRLLGLVFLETKRDYFTLVAHGHVGILVVAAEAEGQGIGRALLAAAVRWGRARAFGRLTLGVFAANLRAREVYERDGWQAEILTYVKPL